MRGGRKKEEGRRREGERILFFPLHYKKKRRYVNITSKKITNTHEAALETKNKPIHTFERPLHPVECCPRSDSSSSMNGMSSLVVVVVVVSLLSLLSSSSSLSVSLPISRSWLKVVEVPLRGIVKRGGEEEKEEKGGMEEKEKKGKSKE